MQRRNDDRYLVTRLDPLTSVRFHRALKPAELPGSATFSHCRDKGQRPVTVGDCADCSMAIAMGGLRKGFSLPGHTTGRASQLVQ